MTAAPLNIDHVSIRPGPAVLSVLRHLNYKPWFALAEFVDNALQSFMSHRDALLALHGNDWRLRVDIETDSSYPAKITIKDNAAGISISDFARAFRPAVVPPDASGLCEFGMGMKSAACWFAPKWHVTTKALGEEVARCVRFDVARIVHDELEELEIQHAPMKRDAHFTVVVLEEPYNIPAGRTVAKIKDHLTDIYRVFVREGVLDLRFNQEPIQYIEPSILVAPYDRDPAAGPKRWLKFINFELGGGQSVTGFAALRDPGNHRKSGFSLFRRGRLIEGSGEEGYRPPLIFGSAGSFRHLRLFGELHLKGFEVSHTKDGFRWNDDEEPFLELLKEHLDSDDLPLLRQADNYRALASKRDRRKAAEEALTRTADVIEKQLPAVLPKVAAADPIETTSSPLVPQPTLAVRELHFAFLGDTWNISIELSDDPAERDWLSVSDRSDVENTVQIRLSMAHPFMVSFAQTRSEDIEALLRVAASIALGEKLARRAGVKYAGSVRRNVNEILRQALSRP